MVKPKPGHNVEYGFVTYSGYHPSTQVNAKKSFDTQEYLELLERLRKRIENSDLQFYDDTTPGDKDTFCSWGLCGETKELYPEPWMHIWPYEFINNGRVAAIDVGGLCPMDTRDKSDGNGCFWTCRIFQHKLKNKDEALKLVDLRISATKK